MSKQKVKSVATLKAEMRRAEAVERKLEREVQQLEKSLRSTMAALREVQLERMQIHHELSWADGWVTNASKNPNDTVMVTAKGRSEMRKRRR